MPQISENAKQELKELAKSIPATALIKDVTDKKEVQRPDYGLKWFSMRGILPISQIDPVILSEPEPVKYNLKKKVLHPVGEEFHFNSLVNYVQEHGEDGVLKYINWVISQNKLIVKFRKNGNV